MLYLIGGENVYLSTKRLDELKDEFVDRFDGIIQIYDADEVENHNEIFRDAETLTLFSKERLIIIKRLFSTGIKLVDKFYQYLDSAKDSNIVFWEDGKVDKRLKLYKLLKKKGVVEEFDKLKYVQLKSWLSKLFCGKCKCDPGCIESLILKVGDDQMQLSLIASNLITLVEAEGKDRLTIEDIDKFVEKTAEESIWEFIDALSEQNRAKALNIIERLLRESRDFVMLIGMIARQFRILAMIKQCLKVGKNQSEIIQALHLHPFVVRKAVLHSRNFSLNEIRKLYLKLVKTDLVVKEGRFDEKLALDLLIAAL
ncbi:DNA polymerase III subunit delta [Candidatus Dojkabacteria bacterium]|nr:DNA polymerase III subunit delta [Candidatus Dojkabacteria bacterium]